MLMVAGKTSDEPAGIVDDVQSVLMNASRRSQVRRSNSHVRARFKDWYRSSLSVEYSNARDGVVVFGSLHVVMSAHVPPVAGEAARVSMRRRPGSPAGTRREGAQSRRWACKVERAHPPHWSHGEGQLLIDHPGVPSGLTYAHPNLMTEAVRMVRGARTGVGLLVRGRRSALRTSCATGPQERWGMRTESVGRHPVSHNPKMLLLGTEIPMAANLKAAKLAKEKGTLVALRLGSMRRESVPAVQSLLLDGNVHILCASH